MEAIVIRGLANSVGLSLNFINFMLLSHMHNINDYCLTDLQNLFIENSSFILV